MTRDFCATAELLVLSSCKAELPWRLKTIPALASRAVRSIVPGVGSKDKTGY